MITDHRTEFYLASDTARSIDPEDCVTVVDVDDGTVMTLSEGWGLVCWDVCYYEDEPGVMVTRMYLDRPYAVTGTVLYSDVEEGEG